MLRVRILIWLVIVPIGLVHAEELPDVTAEAAVTRALAFVEREGSAWMEIQGCASCHQVPSMLWSLNMANSKGLFDEDERLDEWRTWSFSWDNWDQTTEPADQLDAARDNVETISNLILAYAPYATGASPEFDEFARLLVDTQNDDGSWSANGQLPKQKRTAAESQQVSTMWAILAMEQAGLETDEVKQAQLDAYEWLQSKPTGDSVEWWVARWLVERQMSAESADSWREELLARQHADGGWGWLADDPSDAFGTGLAMYAISDGSNEAVQRARAYLLTTQREDGSWPVKSTLERHKDEVIETSAHWGTAWAAIGLMATLE